MLILLPCALSVSHRISTLKFKARLQNIPDAPNARSSWTMTQYAYSQTRSCSTCKLRKLYKCNNSYLEELLRIETLVDLSALQSIASFPSSPHSSGVLWGAELAKSTLPVPTSPWFTASDAAATFASVTGPPGTATIPATSTTHFWPTLEASAAERRSGEKRIGQENARTGDIASSWTRPKRESPKAC